LLLKLCCLQELVFAAEIVFSAVISSRWWIVLSVAIQFLLPNCVGCSESVFAAKIVLPAASQCSLLKLRCLQ
jgi:hypothetical protein